MKLIRLFLFLLISIKSFGQDSLWKKTVFNEVLTLTLPANAEPTVMAYVKGISGGVNSNYYGFQHYDTVFLPIENEKIFQSSLAGFMDGRIADPILRNYNVLVVDTVINSTKGLMAKYTTTNTVEAYKQIYYFATIANNQYYGFYVYSPFPNNNDAEINFFFRSILFKNEKIKERSFKLAPVHLIKKTGL